MCQNLFGCEGVNVKLYDGIGLEGDNGVANLSEEGLKGLYVEGFHVGLAVLQTDEKLGAVAVGHNAVGTEYVKVNGGGRLLLLFGNDGGLHLLAVENAVEAVHNIQKSCSAAVHHACVLENGKDLGGAGKGSLHLLNKVGKETADGALGGNAGNGVFHRLAGNRKDGALCGGHNRGVRLLDTKLQRVAEGHSVCLFRGLKALGNACEELGKDNARVAARTKKHTAGQGLHHLGKVA